MYVHIHLTIIIGNLRWVLRPLSVCHEICILFYEFSSESAFNALNLNSFWMRYLMEWIGGGLRFVSLFVLPMFKVSCSNVGFPYDDQIGGSAANSTAVVCIGRL